MATVTNASLILPASSSSTSSRRSKSPKQNIDWNRALEDGMVVSADTNADTDDDVSVRQRSHSPHIHVDRQEATLEKDTMVHNSLQQIEFVINSTLDISDYGTAVVHTSWDPTEFASEMEDSQNLESMITFTGSVDAAWATTSKEYVEQIWPKSGNETLNAVGKFMKSNADKNRDKREVFEAISGIRKITRPKGDSKTRFYVGGSRSEIIETVQQLAWITSVFRVSSDVGSVNKVYSQASLKEHGKNRYRLEQLPLEEASSSKASCWLPMIQHNVIARGFPIRPRSREQGVEMSLATMLTLADIQYPVYTDNVTMLRGWTTLIYPVKASKDFSSIQWHMVQAEDPEDASLIPNRAPVTNVANWRDVGLETIQNSRSFLGYCGSADIHIGTQGFPPQSSQDVSSASEQKTKWFWRNKITLTMAPNVLGGGGPGLGGEIAKSKVARAKASRASFDNVLDAAAKRPVIIYDVAAKTGWLVPEISVILQLTRSTFLEKTDLAEHEIKKLPSAPVASNGARKALDTLKNGKHKKLEFLRSDEESSWRFYDTVKDVTKLLRNARESRYRDESTESESWVFGWFHTPKLYGWDMADLVDARDNTMMKEFPIANRRKNRWMCAIANHQDSLVLFGRNIQAPIRPSLSEQICQKWDPVPRGENYLVAHVRSLKDIQRQCSGTNNLRKLANKCFWMQPEGSDPWASCNYKSKTGCDRMQQLSEKPSHRSAEIINDGAVIFGTYLLPPERCRPRKARASTTGTRKIPTAATGTSKVPTATTGDSTSQSRNKVAGQLGKKHRSQEAVDEDQPAGSSSASSEVEDSDRDSAVSNSDKSSASGSEVDEESSDAESTIAMEDTPHLIIARKSQTRFKEEKEIILFTFKAVESCAEEGLSLYTEYNGSPTQKKEIKALMAKMSATLTSASEKLDRGDTWS